MQTQVLRKVSRFLRYRTASDLIGQTVSIASPSTVETDLRQLVDSRLRGPTETGMSLSIAKYGILDLMFAAERVEWHREDECGLDLLREFGFVLPRGEKLSAKESLNLEDDPTCLRMLHDGISRNESVLRIFFSLMLTSSGSTNISGCDSSCHLADIVKTGI